MHHEPVSHLLAEAFRQFASPSRDLCWPSHGVSKAERLLMDIAGHTGWGFRMPSSIVRRPSRPDDDIQSPQEREFARWRTAVNIVRRMREAGISCQLTDGDQTRN